MNRGERDQTAGYTIAIVGAGPRGTSVLERLLAALENDGVDAVSGGRTRALNLVVIDPYDPGPGHVWSPRQSRLFLMNTPALFPTVAPERSRPDAAGLSFEQWRASGGDDAELNAVEAAELAAMGPGSYPPRALYGRYLLHVYSRVIARLAAHPRVASIRHERAEVTALHRNEADYLLEMRPFTGDPSRGTAVPGKATELRADAVVLGLGHVPAHPNPKQAAAGEHAAEHQLHYQPPNVPADVDWDALPPGEAVLVRGLGLNFFDVMIKLSVGRGGEFKPANAGAGRTLEYQRSGLEPVLYAASRRGTPYRAKSQVDAFIPESITLSHLSFETVHQLAAEGAPGEPAGRVSFDSHIWPLLHRDVLATYYRTMARTMPTRIGSDPVAFLSDFEAVLGAPHRNGDQVWLSQARDLVLERAPEAGWLDVPAMAHPFAGRGFAADADYQQAVLDYLEADALGSERGEDDPLKMAIAAMNAGRMVVKRLVAEALVVDASRLDEIQGWFEPLVEGLASGPPVQRIEELAALARAGLVRFIGPDPVFSLDAESGVFTGSSPWVDADAVSARHLVEAMMPANRVTQSASELLTQLLADGLARPYPMTNADGEQVPGSGLDVVGPAYRMVDAAAMPHRAVFVIGLQLSSAQWGTAIAAEAGADLGDGARTIGDAQAIAGELLRLAGLR